MLDLKDALGKIGQLDPKSQKEILDLLNELEEVRSVTGARENFLPFVKYLWPTFVEGTHHKIISELFDDVISGRKKRIIINMPPRHRLALDTPIATLTGWKTMGSVQIGDHVFAPDGSPVKVVGKSAVYRQRLYEVETQDGCIIECDEGHLWGIVSRKGKMQKYSTGELLARQNGSRVRRLRSGRVEIIPGSHSPRNAILPRHSAVQWPNANLPIDPYVLGVWLGDGSRRQGIITMADDDAVPVREEFERRGIRTTDQKTKMTFGTIGLKVALRDAGILENKHIPEVYMTASMEQRLDLVRGLMDTDGCAAKDGQLHFSQSNHNLILQFRELLWSLGIRNTCLEYVSGSGKLAWKVYFHAGPEIFLLPRKKIRCSFKNRFGRTIVVNETNRYGDVQCIEVESPDGLFLAGKGMVVTSNTKSEFASVFLPAYFLGRYPEKKIIQTSHTAELAVNFGRRVRNIINGGIFQDVFPNVSLSSDSKAAGRWATNKGGEYYAIGVGGTVTGKGADLFVIDDPHALEINTPIPTPNGFVAIKDLKVGDYVFGPDGEPVKVIAKSDIWHDRKLYSVTTDDGEEILCDSRHLWSVRSDTRLAASHKTYRAEELAEWTKSSRPCLPRHSPVDYPERKLPIDPWVLGAWLGDGTSSLGRITCHPDDREFMIGEFTRRGYETTDLADPYSFGVLGLRAQLIETGLINNKHVPDDYLIGSINQRMALLQGLMDTDGTVLRNGQCGFYNTNKGLVKAVASLLHSLGVKASIRFADDKRGRWGSAKRVWRVMFRLRDAALMPRKNQYTYTPKDKRCRSIEVQPTGTNGSVQCITVDRKDGLFLAGKGYVVTHNSEQEAIIAESNPEIYNGVMEWYESGPRQRLQPGGSIILVMTRWSQRDLTARLLKKQDEEPGTDKWEVVTLPAILPADPEKNKPDRPIWPEFWSLDELLTTKASIPVSKWNAQYQQEPTSEEGALIKREYWQDWDKAKPPECESIIQSWDTAMSKDTRANYSAVTTWGVFKDDEGKNNIILLDAVRGKWEFPILKKKAKEFYDLHKPDICLIEARAAGQPLIYEMRRMGLPVQDVKAGRGTGEMRNDKISRVNSITDIFHSGFVWAQKERLWAQEVIEECAAFPAGEYDDYVDTVTMALQRFRQGGWVGTKLDEEDDKEEPSRKLEYY